MWVPRAQSISPVEGVVPHCNLHLQGDYSSLMGHKVHFRIKLRMSMSHCITSAVQRKDTKSSYCFLKVMIQHSLKKKSKVNGLWEARKSDPFADVLLLYNINYSDIIILSFQGMVGSDIFVTFFRVFIICTFRNEFLWGSSLPNPVGYGRHHY